MNHLPECAVGRRAGEVCPRPHELSDGTNHWWSGWPGAFCLGCGADDPNELCIGGGCPCPCHDEFWKAFEDACGNGEVR